jgi:hypothetical protein
VQTQCSEGSVAQRESTEKIKQEGEQVWQRTKHVVTLREAFYIENKRFDLDTLRVPNRSPTPISKIKDFLVLFDDIWGVTETSGRWPDELGED